MPDAEEKIAFDKFHVAEYLGDAVDKVRRVEHKALCAKGRNDLKGTKHRLLANLENMSFRQWRGFKALRESTLKRWLSWAVRSRLEPMKEVARTIKDHLWGILNAVVLKADNGGTESINSHIKMIKVRSRGFRNKERFRNAICFHLGGLDLYLAGIKR